MGSPTMGQEGGLREAAPGGGEMRKAPDGQQSGNEVLNRSAPSSEGSEHRIRRIEAAAYRRAEQRGFEPGAELDDWLAAERDIDGDGSSTAQD